MIKSKAARRALRMRHVIALSCLIVALFFAKPSQVHVKAFTGLDFSLGGAEPTRGYFSQFPFERIDMVTGDLTLTFTNLVLPGNAGMDVRLEWTWTIGDPWRFGLAGLPTWIDHPDGDAGQPGESGPFLVTYDGARHKVVTDGGLPSGTFTTAEFWRYTLSTRTVSLPNGWTATYDNVPGRTFAMLVQVSDVFGNSIVPHWIDGSNGPLLMSSVDQHIGSDTRTVTFTYNGPLPASMTFVGGAAGGGDRTWTYGYVGAPTWAGGGLAAINPPVGPGWHIDYLVDGPRVTTPTGGTVRYLIEYREWTGRYVVNYRTTGGRHVTPGTWTFSSAINQEDQVAVGNVSMPGGVIVSYIHHAVNAENIVGPSWVLTNRAVRQNGNELSSVDITNVALPVTDTKSSYAVQSSVIHQAGWDFTTSYSYGPQYKANFHQPIQVVQSTDLTRTTTRQYTCEWDASLYRACAVQSDAVTIGSETATSTYGYELTTGFRTSQTVAGVTTTFGRDSFGNVATVTDANNHTTSSTYQWGVIKDTATAGSLLVATRVLNADGSLASVTADGKTTTYQYDVLGRQVWVTPAVGDPSQTIWSDGGDWVSVERGTTAFLTGLDGFGRPDGSLTGDGIMTTVTYDALGRKVYQSYPFTSFNTGDSFTYDGLGRISTIAHPDSTTVQYAYGATDVLVTDEAGHGTLKHGLAFGSPSDLRLVSVTDAASQTWNYTYNVFGSLTRIDAPQGPPRIWNYNSQNRLESETHPENGTTYFQYDPAGNVTWKKDAKNQEFAFQYDANNRLTLVNAPGTEYDIAFGYDASGNRTSMYNEDGAQVKTDFAFDAANRLVNRQDRFIGYTFNTQYTYDGGDRVTDITYPSGQNVHYNYDSAGKVSSVTGPAGITYASNFTYHPNGATAAFQFGNGAWHTMSLDSRQRPSVIGSGPLSLTYGYDGTGNVTSIDDARPENSQWFGYDALDRLTDVWGYQANSFSYDALGNRLTKSGTNYEYDPNTLRLTQTTGVEYSTSAYDANGNLTSDSQGSYYYRPDNMMRASIVNGAWSIDSYDGDNQRIARWDANGTYITIQAGGRPLSSFNPVPGPLNWQRDSIYVGSQLVATLEPWGEGFDVKYFHQDAVGSVRAVTDAAGQTIDRYDYGAFGEGPGVTFSGEKQRFAGTERDYETLLDSMGARYYRSVTGRFNAVDPGHANGSLTRPQSWNAYAYASNNPLRFVDPTGMSDSPIGDDGKFGGDLLLADSGMGPGTSEFDSWVDFYYNAPTSVGFSDYAMYLSNPEGFLAAQAAAARASQSLSAAGEQFLIGQEGGTRLTQYLDSADRPTIGIGHLIGSNEDFSGGISAERALQLFRSDVKAAVSAVRALVRVGLSQNQFDALVSFSYNLGYGALRDSTLRARINGEGIVSSHTFTDYNKVRMNGQLVFSAGLYARRWREYCLWNGF